MTKQQKCIIRGCSRISHTKKHGLCHAHSQRLYKHGFVKQTPIAKRRKFEPFDPTKDITTTDKN